MPSSEFYDHHESGPCFVGSLCCFGCGGGVRVGVAPEEDRRPGRVKEAFRQSRARRDEGRGGPACLRGIDAGIIAETVERAERTERTVQEWPADWRATRMRPVPAGPAGNQNAAEPARARKQEPSGGVSGGLSRRPVS